MQTKVEMAIMSSIGFWSVNLDLDIQYLSYNQHPRDLHE